LRGISLSTLLRDLGIGQTSLIGALLLTQFVGIPFSLLFVRFGQRIGTKRSIVIGLAWYTLISIGGYFMAQAWHFWALAFAAGMVQGGTQALSRSLFGVMAPKAKSAEFFRFYDVTPSSPVSWGRRCLPSWGN